MTLAFKTLRVALDIVMAFVLTWQFPYSYYRAGGSGAAGTASAVPVFVILGACPQVPREEGRRSA